MRKFSLVMLFAAMTLFGSACGWDKVDPGNVGILVDMGTGKLQPVYETKWLWLGWYEQLIEWPAGEQTYVMERGDGSGQIKGDDAIECRSADTQNLKFDVQTVWRINPETVVDLYKRRKDIPLTGKINRDTPGAYLEDLVIRTAMRDATIEACSRYNWSDLLGPKLEQFNDEITARVKSSAEPDGVIIKTVKVIKPWPNDNLAKLMDARLEGQRQQESQSFAASQAERQQKIDQEAARAAGEKARIDAEAKAKIDLANINAAAEQAKVKAAAELAQATTSAEIARVKANQEADAIRARGQAEAEALKAQASVVTPQLVELERARKWNGQGPTTVLGSDTQVVNQIPR